MPQPKQAPIEYVTLAELARASGLAQVTLRRYVKNGRIKAYQPGGKRARLLFRPDALESDERQSIAALGTPLDLQPPRARHDNATPTATVTPVRLPVQHVAGRGRAHWRRYLPG